MIHKSLNDKNIFVLQDGARHYLYAPLAGIIAETNPHEIESIASSLSDGIIPDDLKNLCIGAEPPNPYMPNELSEITILVNQKCNFSCKYCYSANGRSSVELADELTDTIVDWFVCRQRLELSKSDYLYVTFSGGGDPILSFEKVKTLILRLKKRAAEKRVPLRIGIVCNGSLVSESYAVFLAAYVDDIVISFDVLEDVHNAQRSHYPIVANTIKKLCERGISIGLRSTITALNVNRMSEMVIELSEKFKDCRSIAMEAVLAPDLWTNGTELHQFYSQFINNYFKAKSLGSQLGISVGNTIDLSSNSLKSRSCSGKISIAPDGTLTACSRVATTGDKYFNYFTFGKVVKNKLEIDEQRYRQLMNVRADNIVECKSCFAKFHCAGGCMLARLSYNPSQMAMYCNFTRVMLKKSLTYELD